MDDNKLAKLPKWAQDQIGQDSQKIAIFERDIAVLKRDYPDNGVRVMTDPIGDNNIPLPTGWPIRFDIGREHVDVYLKETGGELNLVAQGSRELIILPEASNFIKLYPATVDRSNHE